MIEKTQLKQIIIDWAKALPCRVRIHLFGSYLKGKENPNDIDISLEFIDKFSEDERTCLWCDHHTDWEKDLCFKTRENIELSLFEGEDSPQMQHNLQDASILLFDTDDKDIKEKV